MNPPTSPCAGNADVCGLCGCSCGQKTQHTYLSKAEKSHLAGIWPIPPLQCSSSMHMMIQDQSQPYIYVRETQ